VGSDAGIVNMRIRMNRIIRIICALCVAFFSFPAMTRAQEEGRWHIMATAGYSLGGTAPLGMPASIRSINEFHNGLDVMAGLNVQRDLTEVFVLRTGILAESKGMKTDATVKGYRTSVVQGDQSLDGYFTGRVLTNVERWLITVPVNAGYRLSDKVLVYVGPYVSIPVRAVFDGYVYDGYLRVDTPTGNKVLIGSDEGTRGSYEFNSGMRGLDAGINAGAQVLLNHRFGLFADLTWGFLGIHKDDFNTVEQTLYPIFGTVGMVFTLK